MKLKELEKLINEEIKHEGNEKTQNLNITWKVERIVSDLLKKYGRELYVSNYRGIINIRVSCSCSRKAITIKVKKKVAGKDYRTWYGNTTTYIIDKVIVEESNEYDSIEGFIECVEKQEEERNNYEKAKTKLFEEQLQEKGIDFKEFYNMMEDYKHLSYNERIELAKKCAGKDYYSYY